jgi:hypothetical protein
MELLELIKKFYKNNAFGLLMLVITLIFIFQLPFINADPDAYLSFGRGVWTDPGLYTAQLKSFLINGDWLMENSPCLLITPLYSLILLLPSLIFGNSLLVIKITNLVLFLTIITLSIKTDKRLIPVFFIFFLIFSFQFQIFHFLHIGLVETIIAACFCLLFSISISEEDGHVMRFLNKKVLFVSLITFVIFLFKIQYAYVFVLYPLYLLLSVLVAGNIKEALIKCVNFGIHSLVLLGLYLLSWIKPNDVFFIKTFSKLDSSKYYPFSELIFGLNKNLKINFFCWESKPHFYVFIVCLFVSVIFLSQKETPKLAKKSILFFYAWLLLESTKLFQIYLPTRYVLSMYVVMGIFSSLNIYFVFLWLKAMLLNKQYVSWKWIPVLAVFALGIKIFFKNLIVLNRSLNERTYKIYNANQYFKASKLNNGLILGSWGATLTSGTNYTSLPVWHNYFNCGNKNQQQLNPVAIISEVDQNESIYCYEMHDNLMLSSFDSIRDLKIGEWDMKVYWVSKK